MVPFCCDHRHGLAATHIRAWGTSAMKKLTLLAAAALSCCTYTTTFAQVQILRATGPAAAPRLVSDQTRLDDLNTAPATDASALESDGAQLLPNPFDYFADQLPTSTPQAAAETSSTQLLPEEQSLLEDGLTNIPSAKQDTDDSSPASLPVGRHHRHQRSVVDTIVDQAAIGNIPHVTTTPIYWGGVPQTPNHVAEWLLREDCVGGLWDGYPQQRAAECADMWAHLSGHCGHCGHCGSGGCGTVAEPCNACVKPRVHNRYLSGPSAAPQACGSCDSF